MSRNFQKKSVCHSEIIFCSLNFRAKNAALTKKRSARVTKIYEAKNLKSLAFSVVRPISLERGEIFQWLLSNKKFVKIRYSQKRLKLLPSTLYSVAVSWFFGIRLAHLVGPIGRRSQNNFELQLYKERQIQIMKNYFRVVYSFKFRLLLHKQDCAANSPIRKHT